MLSGLAVCRWPVDCRACSPLGCILITVLSKDPNLILGQIILLIREAMLALLPLISGVVLVALISPVMLGGLVFSGKSLQPKFSKLNPLPGIKRMFSAQTGAELLKAILKTILVGSVTGFSLASLAADDALNGRVSDYRHG